MPDTPSTPSCCLGRWQLLGLSHHWENTLQSPWACSSTSPLPPTFTIISTQNRTLLCTGASPGGAVPQRVSETLPKHEGRRSWLLLRLVGATGCPVQSWRTGVPGTNRNSCHVLSVHARLATRWLSAKERQHHGRPNPGSLTHLPASSVPFPDGAHSPGEEVEAPCQDRRPRCPLMAQGSSQRAPAGLSCQGPHARAQG